MAIDLEEELKLKANHKPSTCNIPTKFFNTPQHFAAAYTFVLGRGNLIKTYNLKITYIKEMSSS